MKTPRWVLQLWWRWKKLCPRCGSAKTTRAHVSCKGETWLMISRTEQVCGAECGWVESQ